MLSVSASAATAAAIAAMVENAAMARKHVVPPGAAWSNTVETATQIAAARKRFGGAGPPGTTRKPATAANAVAVAPRANTGSGSGSTRLAMIDPTAAASATSAAITARLLAGAPLHEPSATELQPAVHKHAMAAIRRDIHPSRSAGAEASTTKWHMSSPKRLLDT